MPFLILPFVHSFACTLALVSSIYVAYVAPHIVVMQGM